MFCVLASCHETMRARRSRSSIKSSSVSGAREGADRPQRLEPSFMVARSKTSAPATRRLLQQMALIAQRNSGGTSSDFASR